MPINSHTFSLPRVREEKTEHHDLSTVQRRPPKNGAAINPQRRWSEIPPQDVNGSDIVAIHAGMASREALQKYLTERPAALANPPSTRQSTTSAPGVPKKDKENGSPTSCRTSNSGRAWTSTISMANKKSSRNSVVSFSDVVSVAEIARPARILDGHEATAVENTTAMLASSVQRRRSTADIEIGIKRRSSEASARLYQNNVNNGKIALSESIDDYTNKVGFVASQSPSVESRLNLLVPTSKYQSKNSKTSVTLCSEDVAAAAQVDVKNDSEIKDEKKQIFGRLKEWLKQVASKSKPSRG
ncbi:hypothetical protein HDU76_010721 [Blyttiomyces sp. JEL0837]|nr:hypothetical protein HDU76_010721 [Blyttiomyces sp. JEL0837]